MQELPFQGFKSIFKTTGYQFPFDDLEDLTEAQVVRQLDENDALVRMFEERHALEHNSRSIGSTTPIDLPERQSIVGCCEEFRRGTFHSDNSEIDDLLLMAENDDQLVYVKRIVNKQYANCIEWLYSVLAETIRHTDNLELRDINFRSTIS